MTVAAAILLLAGGHLGARSMAVELTKGDASYDQATEILDRFRPPSDKLLIADMHLALNYVVQHHPIRYSMLPANDETLDLVAEHHPLGAVIVPEKLIGEEGRISEEALVRHGLSKKRIQLMGDRFKYAIWIKRPARPAPLTPRRGDSD